MFNVEPIPKSLMGKRAMIATLHLEEEWENHPTHKEAPEWSMDHEKTKSETLAGHEKSPLDAGNVDTTSTDSPHDNP